MPYNKNFYATYQDASERSAKKVLPRAFAVAPARTMIDVGCGIGTWLSAALDLGVQQVRGVDGAYVDASQLLIPRDRFIAADLSQGFELPADEQKFDLAMSVEVAEHLPEVAAKTFVRRLTSLSDAVLFSAAIPKQGGTGHINEQWPNYWARLFSEEGYVLADVVRPQCWGDSTVAYYYAQNTFLYLRESELAKYPVPKDAILPPDHWTLRAVHPTRWNQANDPRRVPLRLLLKSLPHAVPQAVKNRIRRLSGGGF